MELDNQQERLLGWLGGLIDGEGSFIMSTLAIKDVRYKKSGFHIRPAINVCNSHKETIIRANLLVKKYFGIEMDYYCEPRGIHRPSHILKVSDLNRVFKLAKSLIPYLYTKKQQAILMLEYVESRIPKIENRRNSIYTEREFELAQSIRSLNRLESSETLRQTPKGDDKVQHTEKSL